MCLKKIKLLNILTTSLKNKNNTNKYSVTKTILKILKTTMLKKTKEKRKQGKNKWKEKKFTYNPSSHVFRTHW